MIARIVIDDALTAFTVEPELPDGDSAQGGSFTVPCGAQSLRDRHLATDPPLPEELTNAIGEMQDHLEDALRELPALALADGFVVDGPTPRVIAAVEFGGSIDEPTFALSRDAAEDVFRTVATEASPERARNPGLPADFVDRIVGGCCALVALLRGLNVEVATVITGAGEL